MEKGKVTETNKRIRYIDIAKGVSIILMIIGHLYTPYGIGYIIYSFHIPFFFIISGYFFSSKQNLRKEIEKRAWIYLRPYFVTLLLYLPLNLIHRSYLGENLYEGVLSWTIEMLYGMPNPSVVANQYIVRGAPIWFLEALFFGGAELLILNTTKVRDRFKCIIILLLNTFAIIVSKDIWMPANLGTGMAACTFIFIGYLMRKYNLLKKWIMNRKVLVLSMFVSSICIVLDSMKNTLFKISDLNYPLYGFDIVGGITGTVLMLNISMQIELRFKYLGKALAYLGRITLPIMCVHALDMLMLDFSAERSVINLLLHLALDLGIAIIFDYSLQKYRRKFMLNDC